MTLVLLLTVAWAALVLVACRLVVKNHP